ncbi:MAG: transcription elongation factor GreA [Halofilum sp. (in: g-proteobacteria)]
MSRSPITARGAAKMREELDRLKHVDRPQVIEAIAEARAHGDLKENAEYHAAREQQGFIEGRISELESKLSDAEVIDVSTLAGKDKIVFGATVDLLDLDSDEEVTYQIVGDGEAKIESGLISISSPIARALIGKREGDVAEVDAPGGRREYEVVGIRYE